MAIAFEIKLKSFILGNKNMPECNLENDIKDLDRLVRIAEMTTILDQYVKNKITRRKALSIIYLGNAEKPPERRK